MGCNFTLHFEGEFMKLFTLLFVALFSFNSFATLDTETVSHSVTEGKYHNGGSLNFKTYDINEESFTAQIKYNLNPKWFVSFLKKKYLNGETVEVLPIDFITEEGYLDLEKSKEREFRGARLVHVGRKDIGDFKDCHVVEIFPASGKWKGKVYYHPSINSVGWAKFEITLLSIKVISPYTMVSYYDSSSLED